MGQIRSVCCGIPSPARNEDLVAYVVGSSLITRRMLENHCRERLEAWQVPREFRIVPALPFNERGKINRVELAKMHLQEEGR